MSRQVALGQHPGQPEEILHVIGHGFPHLVDVVEHSLVLHPHRLQQPTNVAQDVMALHIAVILLHTRLIVGIA